VIKIDWDELERTTGKACEKIRRMFEESQRVHIVGGRSMGRRKATQDEVDRARLAGQTVWVQRFIDGRQLTETQPGILLEAPNAMLPRLIHVPRSVVATWPASSRLLAAADAPTESCGGPLWEAATKAERIKSLFKGRDFYGHSTDPLARPSIAEMEEMLKFLRPRRRT